MEARHLGFYEVVVCGEAQETGSKAPASACREATTFHSRLHIDSGLHMQLGATSLPVGQALARRFRTEAADGKAGADSSAFRTRHGERCISIPSFPGSFTTLTDAELDTELAYDVVGKLTSPFPKALCGPSLPSW